MREPSGLCGVQNPDAFALPSASNTCVVETRTKDGLARGNPLYAVPQLGPSSCLRFVARMRSGYERRRRRAFSFFSGKRPTRISPCGNSDLSRYALESGEQALGCLHLIWNGWPAKMGRHTRWAQRPWPMGYCDDSWHGRRTRRTESRRTREKIDETERDVRWRG